MKGIFTTPDAPGDSELMAWIEANRDHRGDECLIWPFSTARSGYGSFTRNGKCFYVHRYMCEYANGPAPSAMALRCPLMRTRSIRVRKSAPFDMEDQFTEPARPSRARRHILQRADAYPSRRNHSDERHHFSTGGRRAVQCVRNDRSADTSRQDLGQQKALPIFFARRASLDCCQA